MPKPGYLAGHRVHTHDITDPGHTHTENLAATYTQNASTASATTGVSVKAAQG
jgi:hypothetical protein